jgi:hypothetical protein
VGIPIDSGQNFVPIDSTDNVIDIDLCEDLVEVDFPNYAVNIDNICDRMIYSIVDITSETHPV